VHMKVTTASRSHQITTVEVPCGAGALDDRCKDGPARFRQIGDPALRSRGIVLAWQRISYELGTAAAAPIDVVSRTARWTAGITCRLTTCGDTFVVIGGDHSCAIGTWSGVADGLRKSGPLGLVWLDAHMDMHVPETTHSGAINGMPMACLLGYGAPQLISVAETDPAIEPHNLCLVGTRSFEPEELEFAERLGVHVIDMDEVCRQGISAALSRAQEIAANGTAGYGVSLDLDAFDPVDAPGVGTPEPGGIGAAAFLDVWSRLTRDSKCLGIEIAEYNPSCDHAGRTARLMGDLISAAV